MLWKGRTLPRKMGFLPRKIAGPFVYNRAAYFDVEAAPRGRIAADAEQREGASPLVPHPRPLARPRLRQPVDRLGQRGRRRRPGAALRPRRVTLGRCWLLIVALMIFGCTATNHGIVVIDC